MELDNLISLKNASFKIKNELILNSISLNLKKSEIVSLLGDNGAGKSTLFKCLCGLNKFSSGEYFLKNNLINLKKYDLNYTKKLGLECVFQEYSLSLEQPIYKNFFANRHISKFGFIDDKAELKICKEILNDFLGLSGKGLDYKKEASHLSGGEKQGLCIARAIYFNNDIILLDEPTSALALNESKKVVSYIKELKNKQKGVLIITHNLLTSFEISDRFLFLKHGEIAYEMDKKDIKDVFNLYDLFNRFC